MCTTVEGWHIVDDDGWKLFTKTWKPAKTPRAKLIFLHGFTFHCDFYADFFTLLASQSIEVHGYDTRGFGRSVTEPKDKGNFGPTSRVIADISSIVSSQSVGDIPLFLMGHSMGGTAALTFACEGPVDIVAKIRGILCEAPDLGLPPGCPNAASKLQIFAVGIVKHIMPKMQATAKLEPTTLSADPKVQSDYLNDTLCYGTVTIESILGHFQRVNDLHTGASMFRKSLCNLWIGYCPDDLATSYDLCLKWFKKLDIERKEMKIYNDWKSHCLHAEAGNRRTTFAKDVGDWILKRSETDEEASKAAIP